MLCDPAPGLDACFGYPDFVWEQDWRVTPSSLPSSGFHGKQIQECKLEECLGGLWPGIQLGKFGGFRIAGYDKEGSVPQHD